MPVLREGELNIKVTLIDGKRSQDRSWRTVHAELRGNRLRLTLLRDTGKASSQVSFLPIAVISSSVLSSPKDPVEFDVVDRVVKTNPIVFCMAWQP